MDEVVEDKDLFFELEDDNDDDEVVAPRRRADSDRQVAADPEILAKIALTEEKLKKQEEILAKYNKLFSDNEEIEQFRYLETEFADVDDRTKLYQKKLLGKQNEKFVGVLKGIFEEVESLKLKIATTEAANGKIAADVMQLNDSIILQNVARKALERELPETIFIDPKTKKKIPLGQTQVDQALRLYNTKFVEDATFRRQVEDILKDPELTHIQKQNRIGKNIVAVFKEKIDEKLASKRNSAPKKVDEAPAKKVEDPKKDKADSAKGDDPKKELTEEEKAALIEQKRDAVKRALSKSL